ncbi:MAG: family metallopeptidase [Chloroflexi bacterium]|nr:family metallopeptidase [Chloroflexota bacterium]
MRNPPNPRTLSLAERDRRWTLLRAAMADEGIECIVTPPASGRSPARQADARYITSCGGENVTLACLFPLDGDTTVLSRHAERWRDSQEWVADLREAGSSFGQETAKRLRELRLRHGRVGMVGLDSDAVGYGFMQAVTERFSAIEWIDAAPLVGSLRVEKSAEEIGLLEVSAAIVDRALGRIQATARPGMFDYEVSAAALAEIFRECGEQPERLAWASGIRPTPLPLPSHGELRRGYVITAELDAPYAGYRARGAHAFALQTCDQVYVALYGALSEYWERCIEELRVGRPLAEVEHACRANAADLFPSASVFENVRGEIVLEGVGLGGDLPLIRSSASDATNELLRPGWAMFLKASLHLELSGRPYAASWGDTIVIEASGPRRLGSRPPELTPIP